ncbi:hypothetical protein [Halegenticoccus soli]|uniref:hypothetical protein n=1 Tax=Halegenticoccus soli TaxID=1985678 RepID=UPI001E31489A|nr:hypothetical protein [Halegenticoccus soli]
MSGRRSTDSPVAVSTSGRTIDVVDTIERRQFGLRTSPEASPTRVDRDRVGFPVDVAVELTVDRITLPTVVGVYVRDRTGDLVVHVEHYADEELPAGRYVLEIDGPIKLYLRVAGPLGVAANGSETTIALESETDVILGARSRHRSPAATVSTTAEPTDVMAAVSSFGSALKTTTVERSYPTLRGHPPAVVLGDDLDVPPSLVPPETGVRIELPAEHRYVFAAAPLAFYLGATVVEADEPRLVTDAGFSYPLGTGRRFEEAVERTLKQVFFLDCLTRTEGRFPVDLAERERFERRTSHELDFAALYERPLASQVEAYLDVPYSTVEPLLPRWKLTAELQRDPANVELLPFFVDDLAVVRTTEPNRVSATDAATEHVRGLFTRSAGEAVPAAERVSLSQTASMEHVWAGDGIPLRASKALSAAYENRLRREPSVDGIDITVVCNDPAMNAERTLLEGVYGSRDRLAVETTVRQELSTDELARLLASRTDFLHYVGHIDADGFECPDGRLDAASLDSVGVDAFLLNACTSYEQGAALIEAGSVGGIVTLDVIADEDALRAGYLLGSLLNRGFPLRAALEVVRRDSLVAAQYLVLGDGGVTVAQAESGTPFLGRLEERADDYELDLESYVVNQRGMGSLVRPAIEGVESYFLNSGTVGPFRLSAGALCDFLGLETVPLWYRDELRWSDELRDDLRLTDRRT